MSVTLYRLPNDETEMHLHGVDVGEFRKVVWCKTHDSSLSHGLCLLLQVIEEQMVYRGPKCEFVEAWMEVV